MAKVVREIERRLTEGIEAVVLEAVSVAVRAPAGSFDVAGNVFHDLDDGVDCEYRGRSESEDSGESSECGGELHDERVEVWLRMRLGLG